MSGVLRNGEFWLPPEFLTDDDLLMDKENFNGNGLCFPSEFPYEFGESESDEEDISGLTRQLSRSAINYPQKICTHPSKKEAKWVFSGSPQSTLNRCGSWSASSNGSPNGPSSQVPSPPTTPFVQIDDTWDLIYAAAGQVARIKMNNNRDEPNENRPLFAHARSYVPPNFSNNCLSRSLCHHNHFQQSNPESAIKQLGCSIWGKHERGRWLASPQEVNDNRGLRVGVENGRAMGLPQCGWPPVDIQKQQGSGMRGGFVSGRDGVVKRECAGTGVFIPRNPSEARKRPACSTALLAAWRPTGQSSGKNFQPIICRAQAQAQAQVQAAHFNSGHITNYGRRNAAMSQQQQQQQQQQERQKIRAEVMMKHNEVLLPQEWTY